MSAGPVSNALGSSNPMVPTQALQPAMMHSLKAVWNAIKALFSSPVVMTPQAVYTRMHELRTELLEAMGDSSAAMPARSQQEFALRATAMVNDVLLDCMNSILKNNSSRASQEVREASFHTAAERARVIVDRHLQIAQAGGQHRATPQVTSVWVDNPGGAYLPKVERLLVVRAAPPIENLVLRGGGAKGIGNPPALRALENLGRLSELKKVVGTSAGALTAVCLASGMSAQSFQRLSNDTDMQALKSSPSGFKQRYPEVALGQGHHGAGTTLETLDRASASSVTHYLRDHWEEVVNTPQWSSFGADDRQRLKGLRDQVFEKSPRTGQMVTFRDLNLLHQLAPSRFKELVLTGYNTDQKQAVYFSAASHPDMPVALAGRISMGIPLFFKAVGMEVEGRMQTFVDGGVGSNMPSEAILEGLHGQELGQTMAKTLLMTYDEDGRAYSILHGSSAERKQASGGLLSRFTNDRLDAEKVHFSGVNVLPVFHGALGTFSFGASREQVEQAQTQSMLKTLDYIENTMGQARHDLVPDTAAAVRLLSVDEQQRFLQEHGNTADPLHVALCGAIRAQLYPPEAAAAA